MRKLTTRDEVDAVFAGGVAVLFKHSTMCPISRHAHREVALFMSERPEVPVYIIDVLRDRDVSGYIEKKTGVYHQSPQAFVVKDGAVAWHETHYRVSADSLRSETA